MSSIGRAAHERAEQAYREWKEAKRAKKRESRRRRRLNRKAAKQFRKGYIDYRSYIDSPEWREKRLEFITAVDGRCETCGTTRRLQVHHRHYKTLGRETQKDVKVQCWRCHENTHEQDGVPQNDPLSKEFAAIVKV